MVGTLTASVAAVVLFRCAHWMLDNCSVVGMLMAGRRRPGWNRYRRRCRVFFSERTNFQGASPHIWQKRRRRRTVASIGMLLAPCARYAESARCHCSLHYFLRDLLVSSVRSHLALSSLRRLLSAFGVGSGPVSSRRHRPPCPRNTCTSADNKPF